jgi:tRNA nucleotidyltransferase (CCA-adding enzyme)
MRQKASFSQSTPDYYDAMKHIRNARAMELKILVPDITDDQVNNQIRQEEIGLASQLMRQGSNPVEYAYQAGCCAWVSEESSGPGTA